MDVSVVLVYELPGEPGLKVLLSDIGQNRQYEIDMTKKSGSSMADVRTGWYARCKAVGVVACIKQRLS